MPCARASRSSLAKNKIAYVAGIAVLWIASDWPLHDISEEYLYSAHMIQHLLISMIVPPLLLTAMPEWLARLIISDQGRVGRLDPADDPSRRRRDACSTSWWSSPTSRSWSTRRPRTVRSTTSCTCSSS